MRHRTRNFLVRQLTQLANVVRAHLGGVGLVVPKGGHNMGRLVAEAEGAALPLDARMVLDLLVGQFTDTKARIDAITVDLRRATKVDETARRLQTMRVSGRSWPLFWSPHYRTCQPSARPGTSRLG